jgi:hypothetical protein
MGSPALPTHDQILALRKASELAPVQTVPLSRSIILGPQTLAVAELVK